MKRMVRLRQIIRERVLPGLLHRVRRRASVVAHNTAATPNDSRGYDNERLEYERLVNEFRSCTRALNFPGLANFFWYHTVDLGNGLVTPGDYDYRGSLSAFHFPDNMRGLKVLDVGVATGFFAFELEKRAAYVVSVELPSLSAWDMVSGERDGVLRGLMSFHQGQTEEDAYHRHLTGPFDFCSKQLKSSVERRYSTVYGLTPAVLGQSEFDRVFLGDLLLHLFSPFKALEVVAPLCRGTLVISNELFSTAKKYTTDALFGKR